MSVWEINKHEYVERWDVYSVDSDEQEHYLGRYLGWAMWGREITRDSPAYPEPWVFYVGADNVPGACAIYNTRIKKRKLPDAHDG